MTDVLTEVMRALYRPSTVLCPADREEQLRAELKRRHLDTVVTLYSSSLVPEGKLIVIDSATLEPK